MALNNNVTMEDIVSVYCDGSTFGNGKKESCGGIGVWFGPNDKRNISEPFTIDLATNQRTEIYAMLRTLKILEEETNKHVFHIYTDSMYVINCLTKWMQKWEKNKWLRSDGSAVKNLELLKQTWEVYKKNENKYKIIHVRSHTKKTR